MIPSNEPNASSRSPTLSGNGNEPRRQQALELLAEFTQMLRLALLNSATAAATASLPDIDKVHGALQVASHLDSLTTQDPSFRLCETDLARASAMYACPPLLDLAFTSARDLYLRTLLTNRDLPDSMWRAIVSQNPAETRQVLSPLQTLFSGTSTLTSSLHAFLTLSPAPPPPSPRSPPSSLTLTPLQLARFATARLLMLHTPTVTFSLFVSKHLPILLSAPTANVHVELALLCVLVPGAPTDRIQAVVDVLVHRSDQSRSWLYGVGEDVVVAAAIGEPRVAEAVLKCGGKLARVVMEQLGVR